MKKLLLTALAASFLTAGCASPEALTADESVADREYVTGSNIPRKKSSGTPSEVTVVDREEVERIRDTQPQQPPQRQYGRPGAP
jgi:uncharacterized protein YcfL